MIRAILRNVQFALLLAASLLVLLAFQRLKNDDLFSIGQLQHSDPDLDRQDIIGGGGRHSKIFTHVISFGLFRFVVPFRWESDGPDGEEITAAGPKAPAVRRKIPGKRKTNTLPRKPGNVNTMNKFASSNLLKGDSVAYLVPVQSCPSEALELTEGIAVLRQSIVSAHNTSEYNYKMFLVVRRDSEGCQVEETANKLGFEVLTLPDDGEFAPGMLFETPIQSAASQAVIVDRGDTERNFSGNHNRDHSLESDFLAPLSDHDIVVMLRMDSIVIKPLDSLFDTVLQTKEYSLEIAQLLRKSEEQTRPHEVDAFAAAAGRYMDFYIAKRGWRHLFQALSASFEYLSTENQNSHPSSGTLNASTGRSPLKRLYARHQQHQSKPAVPAIGFDTSSVLWLDCCLFSRRKKNDGNCDFETPFEHSWVASSGSCSPPWGCNGHNYDGGAEGDYCEELHRAWFHYRTQLDQSHAQEQSSMKKGSENTRGDTSYGTYCKHGGAEGYVRYDPQNRIRSRVARFLRNIGWN